MVAHADQYRIATFAAPLSRDGPGLLLRDILKSQDDQLAAISSVIDRVAPDVLLLTDFDYDLDGYALAAFADALETSYPYRFALRPNTGLATGLDMDGDGRLGGAADAQGFGLFAGDGGMAILSQFPIDAAGVTDLSSVLWRDLPGATLPQGKDGPFLIPEVRDAQRLSTAGHWIVPILPTYAPPFFLMAFAATPPVFDGPEDRNGLRNRDELRLWEAVLDGQFGTVPDQFVVLGNANLDPVDGQGDSAAMARFLDDPRIVDPQPQSGGAIFAADPAHRGPHAQDTADWPDNRPGNLRVSYVLPSENWQVADSGVFWPAPGEPGADLLGNDGLAAGPHRLVWVDISR